MIVQGSLGFSPSGRKRKTVRKVKKAKQVFKPLEPRKSFREDVYYPSASMTPYRTPEDTSYKAEESKNYTVSIAFNKGAYQVIPKSEIKDIGK